MAKNPIFSILWLALLVFIAWPVAAFCAGFWILLQVRLNSHCGLHLYSWRSFRKWPCSHRALVSTEQPFEAVFGFVKQITAFLEKLITWPRDCGHGMFSVPRHVSPNNAILTELFSNSHHELPAIFPFSHVEQLNLLCSIFHSCQMVSEVNNYRKTESHCLILFSEILVYASLLESECW